jgi:hypothetical protein
MNMYQYVDTIFQRMNLKGLFLDEMPPSDVFLLLDKISEISLDVSLQDSITQGLRRRCSSSSQI